MGANLKVETLTAFSSGEFTPSLAGRVDSQDYKYGVRFVENFLPEVQGGLKKFYGTRYIGNIGSPAQYIMVPFDGADVPIVLVIHDDGVSVVDDEEFYDIDLTINVGELKDLRWQQCNDVIYFVEKTVKPFCIKYKGRDENTGKCIFEYEQLSFKDEPYFPVDWTGNYNGPITVSGDSGTVTIDVVQQIEGRLYLPNFLLNMSGDKDVMSSSGNKVGVITGGVIGVSSHIGTTTVSILRYRSGAVTEIFSANIGTQKTIKEYKRVSQYGSYNYTKVYLTYKTVNMSQIINVISTYLPSVSLSENKLYLSFTDAVPNHQSGDEYAIKLSQGASSSNTDAGGDKIGGYKPYKNLAAWEQIGTSYEPIIPTSFQWGDTNIVGRKIKFLMEPDVAVYNWTPGESVTAGKIRYSTGSYYKALTSGTCGNVQPIHHRGVAVDGAEGSGVSWSYLHSGTGTATVVSVQSDTQLTAVVDGYLPVTTLGLNSYNWQNYQWSMWGFHQLYPSEVFFFKNRLGYFCSTDGYGCWVSMSHTDDFSNFATESYGQVLDTCGINTLISGHTDNNINWVMSGDRLYCGSYAGEYNIYGDNVTVSPSSCFVDPITNVGGAPIRPIRLYGLNLFVGRGEDEIYTISYDYTTDDYSPENIGFMSAHLLEERVVRWDVLKNKDRNIYFVTKDKHLRVINYVKELKNLGYFRINVSADVLDVVNSCAGSRSLTYVIVDRGNGLSVEKFMSENPVYMLSERHFKFESLTPVTITAFAQQEVWVKNNVTGQFYNTTLGLNGEFDNVREWLDFSIGLPMRGVIHTQPTSGEKIEGLQQKSVRFIVRLKDCGSFDYGSSVDFSKRFHYNDWNTQGGQQWNSAHKLTTGDIQLPSSFGYTVGQNKGDGEYPNDTGVALNVYAETPEPFTLLSLSCIYV